MKKLLVAAAFAASFAGVAPAAQACTFETCPGTSVVCTRVNCNVRVCYFQPDGSYRCLIGG